MAQGNVCYPACDVRYSHDRKSEWNLSYFCVKYTKRLLICYSHLYYFYVLDLEVFFFFIYLTLSCLMKVIYIKIFINKFIYIFWSGIDVHCTYTSTLVTVCLSLRENLRVYCVRWVFVCYICENSHNYCIKRKSSIVTERFCFSIICS